MPAPHRLPTEFGHLENEAVFGGPGTYLIHRGSLGKRHRESRTDDKTVHTGPRH
jgi:hypothetical protein